MQSGLHGILGPVGVANLRYRPMFTRSRSRPASQVMRERISVKDFGAVGDGRSSHIRRNTKAFQDALDYATKFGGILHVPQGRYCMNGVSINEAATTDDADATRVSIIGDGSGASQITIFGATPAISYTGATVGFALQSYFRVEGLRIEGDSVTTGQHGIQILGCAFASFEDLVIYECDDGFIIYDTPSVQIATSVIRFNKRGVIGSFVTGSRPNNITLLDCVLGNNTGVGAVFAQGALCRLIGGSVEGNGLDSGAAIRGGVKFEDAGVEGSVGAYVEGVYFEANQGTADLWIDQTTATRCHHHISGNTFNRLASPLFATNCIRFDCSGGTALTASVQSNGFKGFGGYTPSAARLYIDTSNCAGTAWRVNIADTNNFEAALETPVANGALQVFGISSTTPQGIKSSHATSGMGYAPGAGGTVTQATSKSTGVTLNTLSGQITMNAASLGASAAVNFVVSNTAYNAALDVVLAQVINGTNSSYAVLVLNSNVNAFTLRVTNISGGALAEPVQINFVIFKGAAT